MGVKEGGSGENGGVDLDWKLDGEVWPVNLAKEANKSYQRKKKKLETETAEDLVQNGTCRSIFEVEEPGCKECVQEKQELQSSTSDVPGLNGGIETVVDASEDNSVVRVVVGPKVVSASGVRFPSELRLQVLEDLEKMPEVEVCKR